MIDLDKAERQLRRSGIARDDERKISVKIVEHPAWHGHQGAPDPEDFAWAVETTVDGDRRLPIEAAVPLKDAISLALAQLLNPRDHYEYIPTRSWEDQVSRHYQPFVPLGDLLDRYRKRGLDDQAAWRQYVTDTILQPQVKTTTVDAREFMQLYRKG